MPSVDASAITTQRRYAAIAGSSSAISKGVPSGGYVAGGFSAGRILSTFTPAQKLLRRFR
jgi:hypothetical protein